METIRVTVGLTLEDVDVVLNALEEKSLNVSKLRQDIFNDVSAQVATIQQEQKYMKEQEEKELAELGKEK